MRNRSYGIGPKCGMYGGCSDVPRRPCFVVQESGCRLNRDHDYPVEILGAVDAAEQVTDISRLRLSGLHAEPHQSLSYKFYEN